MGAIFCTVIKIMHFGHDKPSITEGNQKWTGAAPLFNKREAQISVWGRLKKSKYDGALAKIMHDPKAWIKKYFRAASDE